MGFKSTSLWVLGAVACAAGTSAMLKRPLPVIGSPGEAADRAAVLSEAHHLNEYEVMIGRLGARSGTTADVRDLGTRLMRDHAAADKALLATARQESVPIKTAALSNEETGAIARLKAAESSEFDSDFLAEVASGQQKAIDDFDEAVARWKPSRSSDLLKTLVPTLHEHAGQAEQLATDKGEAERLPASNR